MKRAKRGVLLKVACVAVLSGYSRSTPTATDPHPCPQQHPHRRRQRWYASFTHTAGQDELAARATLARICSAVAVHMNGFGSLLLALR
jgi:hypothetical protein